MSIGTLTFAGRLVVTSCWCGIAVGIPEDLYLEGNRNHKLGIYCPLGHTFVFTGETEAQKYKRLAQASLRATKGVVTRMRKRAITGTCAFCHRHFANVERHVSTQHPSETP